MSSASRDRESADVRQRAIVRAIRSIPRGEVRTYGEVADAAGLPGRARLVARVLSIGDPAGLPWHRVLRAGGRIAFAEGSPAALEQAERLRAEGLRVERLRVWGGCQAHAGLDAALWSAPP
jgi:methylated-DNA-protein-cysteine methyltransferase related protein